MESQIKTYTYPNGDIQKVQLVTLDSWQGLNFLHPVFAPNSLDKFAHIYEKFLVPACPWLFGNILMFRLPEDVQMPYGREAGPGIRTADSLTAAARGLAKNVRYRKGQPFFRDDRTARFYRELEQRGCIRLIRGKLPFTQAIPVSDTPGYLTDAEPEARLKVNASFFIMDSFDCATVFDHVGTVLGLCVKNGKVHNPPLYKREALLVRRNGSITIEMPDIREITLEIGGCSFRHGKNATIYTRPNHPFTPPSKETKLIIVGDQVAGISRRASVPVPASGFVLCTEQDLSVSPGDPVTYLGMEDVVFGIQVGNSIVVNGEKTTVFRSRFYNIRHLEPVPYPPSLYPMDYDHARAARIALGANAEGKPMLLWAEGAAKFGYEPGKMSCGASLKEMAEICADLGMVNAVNLDGGGSAQILLDGKRSLKISDRMQDTFAEAERPVPLGLMVK